MYSMVLRNGSQLKRSTTDPSAQPSKKQKISPTENVSTEGTIANMDVDLIDEQKTDQLNSIVQR